MAKPTLAVLSFEEVMKYVPSGLSWMSVISALWLSSTLITSSAVLTLYFATFPDSWPVRTQSARGAKTAQVAFEPDRVMVDIGSLVSKSCQVPALRSNEMRRKKD